MFYCFKQNFALFDFFQSQKKQPRKQESEVSVLSNMMAIN